MPRNEAAQIRLPVPRTPAHQPALLWSAMIVGQLGLATPQATDRLYVISSPVVRDRGWSGKICPLGPSCAAADRVWTARVSESPDSPGGHSAPQSAPQNDLPETAQPHDQLQFPNRSARSRHGHPAQVRKKIPSITGRWS